MIAPGGGAMNITINGVDLAWEEMGEGAPLLWLHGFLGRGRDWRHAFKEPPAGFRLIAPDLHGHGASGSRPGPYSFDAAAQDVLALIDHLGIDTASIVGVSGGGIVAMHVATMQPGRVSRLVLVSAPPEFPQQARAIQRNFTEEMLGAELATARAAHSRDGQFEQLIADGDDPNFSTQELGTITAETLIVFGDRDPFYPVSIACHLREAIPKSWLWVVPNGGHGPIFGAAAPQFSEVAAAFLGGAWSAQAS
jgi:pimeloyl-ACP methyl ester carboxylesterase